jgi:hypothetical protein
VRESRGSDWVCGSKKMVFDLRVLVSLFLYPCAISCEISQGEKDPWTWFFSLPASSSLPVYEKRTSIKCAESSETLWVGNAILEAGVASCTS